jgi:hypothetical protein
MSHPICALTVGAVQHVDTHDATRSRWGFSSSAPHPERSRAPPVHHLHQDFIRPGFSRQSLLELSPGAETGAPWPGRVPAWLSMHRRCLSRKPRGDEGSHALCGVRRIVSRIAPCHVPDIPVGTRQSPRATDVSPTTLCSYRRHHRVSSRGMAHPTSGRGAVPGGALRSTPGVPACRGGHG